MGEVLFLVFLICHCQHAACHNDVDGIWCLDERSDVGEAVVKANRNKLRE